MIVTLPAKALKYLDSKIVQVEIDDHLLKREINYEAVEKAKKCRNNVESVNVECKRGREK